MSGFRRIVVASAASQAGDWLYTIALMTFLYDTTGSVAWVAALTFVRLGPYLVLEPIAGLVVDRIDPRSLMVASDVARAALMCVLAAVVWTEGSPLLVLVLTGVSTCASAPYPLALWVVVPQLVGEDRLVAANAKLSTIENLSIVLGPTLGAVLLLAGSPGVAVAINAASFVVAAVAVARLPRNVRPVERGGGEISGVLADLRAGWATLTASSLAVAVILFAVVDNLVYGADTVLLLLVSEALGTGSSGVGYLFAAVGLGGVLAAVLGRRLAASRRAGSVLGLCLAGYALPTAFLLAWHSPLVAFALEVVHGAGFVLIELVAVTTLQRTLPPAVMGRVFGIYGAAVVAGILIGAVLAPVLVRLSGLTTTLLLFGIVPAAIAVLLLPALRPIDVAAATGVERLADRVRAISRLGLFAAAPQATIERLAASAVAERITAGTVVIRQGDRATDFFVLTKGAMSVHMTRDGRTRRINRMKAGDYFGELGLLCDGIRTATVTADIDCAVLRITGTDFGDGLATAGGVSRRMSATMTARLARSRQ